MIQSVSNQTQLPDWSLQKPVTERSAEAPHTGKPANSKQLTAEEQKEVQKLRARDREVRAHEQAHQAAGGQYITHGASYSYQQGPDGQRYAVGGEVGIDSSPESDPQATIRKMQIVRAAALAPASPSGQDRQVAAQASRHATKARAELSEEQAEKADEKKSPAQPGELLDIRV